MKHDTRKHLISGVIGIAVLLVSQSISAQLPDVATSSIQVDRVNIQNLWFQALQYLRNGDLENAKLAFEDVNLKKLELGLHNLSSHSLILVKESQNLQRQGGAEQARVVLDIAQTLSPDISAVYFASARWRFHETITDFYGIGRDIWRGSLLKCTDVLTLICAANRMAAVIAVAGILTSASFILFSFVYYRRAIFYQIKEKLPLELPLLVAHVLGWIVVGSITLGLGIAWGMLFLAFLLVWHLEPVSKRILQVVLFFGGIVAILLLVIGVTYRTSDGEYFQTLYDLSRGEFSSKSVANLQQHLKDAPDDVYAIFGLGLIAQKTGSIQEAIQAYSMIPRQYADWARVQNNLGNLYQAEYRRNNQEAAYQKAEDAYDNAMRSVPKMFEPHYNSAQLLLVANKSSEAGDEIQKAREIDYTRYTRFSEYIKDNIVMVDASFSTWALMKRLFYQDFFRAGILVAEELWASCSRFRNPWFFSIASGMVLLLSLLTGAKQKVPKTGVVYCRMCGDPYAMKRKRKAQDVETFCTQCTYIFKKKTIVKPEKRAAKVKQIQLRQRFRGLLVKVFSLCCPGAGQVYFGYPVKGVLIAFLFYLGGTYYLLKGLLHLVLDTPGGMGTSWGALLFFILLGFGSYLFNVYDVLKLSPKNQ